MFICYFDLQIFNCWAVAGCLYTIHTHWGPNVCIHFFLHYLVVSIVVICCSTFDHISCPNWLFSNMSLHRILLYDQLAIRFRRYLRQVQAHTFYTWTVSIIRWRDLKIVAYPKINIVFFFIWNKYYVFLYKINICVFYI